MRRDSLTFLIIGFTIGFAALYFWTKQREPSIVNAMPPRLVLPAQGGSGGPPESQAPPPQVDLAQVQKLQDRIKANPQDFEAFVELGNIDFDQKNYSEAVTYYQKALSIKDAPDVRTDLGTMLFYSNRYDEAMKELDTVLAKNPTHAQALFNKGVVLLHGKNDPQHALETWQKLVESNPNFPQVDVVKQQIESLKQSLNKK